MLKSIQHLVMNVFVGFGCWDEEPATMGTIVASDGASKRVSPPWCGDLNF
jgi:hypothetical protein